tara:strand:+ start:1619 stop:2911 length:1293 start_codon:yes stop_codon:yes gene_type:complete
MALPTLTPASNTSVSILPITGNTDNVNLTTNPLPYGMYITKASTTAAAEAFISGAADQVGYAYSKLGGDILDVELSEYQVYAAYEESCLEYSYIVNIHQAKNTVGSLLGNPTGTFDQDGEMVSGNSLSGSNIETKYPQFSFEYAKRVGSALSTEGGLGGDIPIYSASFGTTTGQQDYDLQTIISSSAHNDSDSPFYQKVGDKRITIRRVFYKTPHAMWRFFGYYGGLNTVGNMSYYGQYADDSTFEVIPVWQNKAQAMAFEDAIYTRTSHFSYEIKDNRLRLFPNTTSISPTKMWVEFSVKSTAWDESDGVDRGVSGINNMNTLPFENIEYLNINSIGKQWIRRFAIALCKEMLGSIRSKFSTIPIPGSAVTLNGPALVSEAKAEQLALRDELKLVLDEMTYPKLAEQSAQTIENTTKTMQGVSLPVFVG